MPRAATEASARHATVPRMSLVDVLKGTGATLQMFDIGANRDDKVNPGIAILFTHREVKEIEGYQLDGGACEKCKLLVAPLGFGFYAPNAELDNGFHPVFAICKACWGYSRFNPTGNVHDEAPPVRSACCSSLRCYLTTVLVVHMPYRVNRLQGY